MKISRIILGVILLTLLVGIPYSCARGICQHRAAYPGGIIFIGHGDGVFGTEYARLFWHRMPYAPDAFPENVTLHFGERALALSALTPERATELGGTLPQGGWRDAQGNSLEYHFEEGRLNHLSFDSMWLRFRDTGPEKFDFETITMSINGGTPFTVPISHEDLVRHCGKPTDTYLQFAQ